MSNILGTGVALITPFNNNSSIDFKSLANLIEHVINGGVDFLVILGTTAETTSLSVEEKKEVINFIIEKNKRRLPLVLGIGGNNTDKVIKEILSTDLSSFAAILSVTPYYNKPSQEGLYSHYKEISQASPIPIILYNVPSRTACDLRPETVMRLADHPNIVGIKEALDDVARLNELMAISDSQIDTKYFSILSGDDQTFNSFMANGGDGVISVAANIIPSQISQICSLNLTKQFADASELNSIYTNIFELLFVESNPIPVKWMLQRMERIGSGIRLPLVPFSKDFHEKTINEMIKLKLL